MARRNLEQMITFYRQEIPRIGIEIKKRTDQIEWCKARIEELTEKVKVKTEKEKAKREREEKIQRLKAEIKLLRGGRDNGDGQDK